MTEGQPGQALAARRAVLKLSMRAAAKRAGISPTTWSDLEKGAHPPSSQTQRGVADALLWQPDWFDVIAAGGDPVEVDPVSRPGSDDVLRRVAALEQALSLFAESDAVRAERLVAEVAAFAERLDAVEDQLRGAR